MRFEEPSSKRSCYDYAIIGGGIVGLAVAWTAIERRPGLRVLVLEKESRWASHQTGRNSGVIHSGIYYKPGSLKAKLCRQGNRRMVEFCQEHRIPHEVCGKVIVATRESELAGLEQLKQRGLQNGLSVRTLTAEQVKEIEPHVQCRAGLHVPSTGIVDYTAVCRKLADLIASRQGDLQLGARVTRVRFADGLATLESTKGDYAARCLVNCAGLQSDRMARRAGTVPETRIVPFRGEYYELIPHRRTLVHHLVYPVPNPQFPFLGVHFTRMIDGSVHAGPNAVLSLKREGYHRCSFNLRDFSETMFFPGFWHLAARNAREGLLELHRSFSKNAFVRSLQQLIPEIESDDLLPGQAGVRAQALRRDGTLLDDFLIIKQPQAIHVCNAPSPAATAALEIAGFIVDQF